MRPVRAITAEEENYRLVELVPGNPRFVTSKRDSIEPEPVGTVILKAFRITGYDPDCDGSLMARLESIDCDGEASGWRPDHISLYPESALVVMPEELKKLFEVSK